MGSSTRWQGDTQCMSAQNDALLMTIAGYENIVGWQYNELWLDAVGKAMNEMQAEYQAYYPALEIVNYYSNADTICKSLFVKEAYRKATSIYTYKCQKAKYRQKRKEARRAKGAWDAQ